MATHQALSGTTDEAFLQRMVRTYAERFGESFWAFFTNHVASRLPPRPVIVDLGCGPGLFVQALGERYPQIHHCRLAVVAARGGLCHPALSAVTPNASDVCRNPNRELTRLTTALRVRA